MKIADNIYNNNSNLNSKIMATKKTSLARPKKRSELTEEQK